jgi:hypothetical protein
MRKPGDFTVDSLCGKSRIQITRNNFRREDYTAAAGFLSVVGDRRFFVHFPQHCLNFFPLPQGHGSLRPTFGPTRTGFAFETASDASLTMSAGFPDPLEAVAVPPPRALAD